MAFKYWSIKAIYMYMDRFLKGTLIVIHELPFLVRGLFLFTCCHVPYNLTIMEPWPTLNDDRLALNVYYLFRFHHRHFKDHIRENYYGYLLLSISTPLPGKISTFITGSGGRRWVVVQMKSSSVFTGLELLPQDPWLVPLINKWAEDNTY